MTTVHPQVVVRHRLTSDIILRLYKKFIFLHFKENTTYPLVRESVELFVDL